MQTLRRYVYAHGMQGTADKNLMEDLYAEFNLDEFAAARRDKVQVSYLYQPTWLHCCTGTLQTPTHQKVSKLGRTAREVREMIQQDDVGDVAKRLGNYLEMLEKRPGGKEAVEQLKAKLLNGDSL
jgi:hypothetical protein